LFQEALKAVLSPDFKTTSSPVALDFFIRHGIINPKNGENSLTFSKDGFHRMLYNN